jgi:hypothetical protein
VCGCMMGGLLACGSGSEVDGLFIERALVPTDEGEVVGGCEEEGVVFGPLEHVQRDYFHWNN